MGRQSSTQFGALGETQELPGYKQAEKLQFPVHGEASEFRGEEEQGQPWKEEGDSAPPRGKDRQYLPCSTNGAVVPFASFNLVHRLLPFDISDKEQLKQKKLLLLFSTEYYRTSSSILPSLMLCTSG